MTLIEMLQLAADHHSGGTTDIYDMIHLVEELENATTRDECFAIAQEMLSRP